MTEQLGGKRMPWELDSSQNSHSDPEVMKRVQEHIRHDLKHDLVSSPPRMFIRKVFDNIATFLGGPAHVEQASEESLLVAKKTLSSDRK